MCTQIRMQRRRPVLLLDVDGVILDNNLSAREWDRLAPLAFGKLLGGDPAAWSSAQDRAWCFVEQRANHRLSELPRRQWPSPEDWWRDANADWIVELCAIVGAHVPATLEQRVAAAEWALTAYFGGTRAIFPGVREAVRVLANQYEIHMASGNHSIAVDCHLKNVGVRAFVGQPYGTDLLGAYKGDATFYDVIASSIGRDPSEVVVVDDTPWCIENASAIGAKTVIVGQRCESADLAVESLAELPLAVERIDFREW